MKKEVIHKCPICSNDSGILDRVPTINLDEKEKVELRCCHGCGHWWHSPIPSQAELNEMYHAASPFVVSAGAKETYQNKNTLDNFQRYVIKHNCKKSGNYLEIGAGGGYLLRYFRSMNYNCYGVDPGQWVDDSSIVKRNNEIPEELKFDIIILQDVLEHIFDPVGLINEIKNKARDGSSFFCSFPCNDSRSARIFKGKWAMVRPYGHLHYFSFNSTKKMFSDAGLMIQDMRLEQITPIYKPLLALNIRWFLYELIKGGRDQMYLTANYVRPS